MANRPLYSSTMAAKNRVNAENLETLGAERLARLLITEAAERDAGVKRRLRLELAAAKTPGGLQK